MDRLQDFHKPFDAPAVIVVGHQTSGKSALIEALMGFQFNQVRARTWIEQYGGDCCEWPVVWHLVQSDWCIYHHQVVDRSGFE